MVESGNSRFQDVVDAFVSGRQVPDATLRQTWQNTTVANFVWERPIYEQFFRAVWDVNTSLPKQKQLRVLLGDPPIDWKTVRTADDLLKWLTQRDSSAPQLCAIRCSRNIAARSSSTAKGISGAITPATILFYASNPKARKCSRFRRRS